MEMELWAVVNISTFVLEAAAGSARAIGAPNHRTISPARAIGAPNHRKYGFSMQNITAAILTKGKKSRSDDLTTILTKGRAGNKVVIFTEVLFVSSRHLLTFLSLNSS